MLGDAARLIQILEFVSYDFLKKNNKKKPKHEFTA